MDEEMESCGAGPIPEIQEPEIDPPVWITTEWLDSELFNAIIDDSSVLTAPPAADGIIESLRPEKP